MRNHKWGGESLLKTAYPKKGSIHRGLSLLLSLCMVGSLFSGMAFFPAYAQETGSQAKLTEPEEATREETREEIKCRLIWQIRKCGWDPYGSDMSLDEFYALMELFQEGALPLEKESPMEKTPVTIPDAEEPNTEDFYTEALDTEEINTEEIDTEEISIEETDVEETNTENPDVEELNAEDPNIEEVDIKPDTDQLDTEEPNTTEPDIEMPRTELLEPKQSFSISAPGHYPDTADFTPDATAPITAPDDPVTDEEDEMPEQSGQSLLHIPRTMFLFDGLNPEGAKDDDGSDISSQPVECADGKIYASPLDYDNGRDYEPIGSDDSNGTQYHYPHGLDPSRGGLTRPPENWMGIEMGGDMEVVVVEAGNNQDDTSIAGNVDQGLFLKYQEVYVRRVTAQDNDVTVLGAIKLPGTDTYIYYYTNNDQQSTEVSATTLPAGQKFIVHYVHTEYPISYTIRLYEPGKDNPLSYYQNDIAQWVRGMETELTNDPAWKDVIFDKNFPSRTDMGAYAFNATAPDGYTLSFYLASDKNEEGVWTNGSAQLVKYGDDHKEAGEYKDVNGGWALGMEPVYQNAGGSKLMPDESKGPQELTTTGTFYNNKVTAPRIVAAVLEKKDTPYFDFKTFKSSPQVSGRGSTALAAVTVTSRETGKSETVPYDYEDEYLWRKYGENGPSKYKGYSNSDPIGNLQTADRWNWNNEDIDVNKGPVKMTAEGDGAGYSYQWTFQTNTGSGPLLLDSLEINRVGITIPFFAKYAEDGHQKGEEYPSTNGGSQSWWAETGLPDGATVRVEYLMVFNSGTSQRVYRIKISGAKNNMTITGMNLMMYTMGAPEISVYQLDGITGATSRSNIRTAAIQYYYKDHGTGKWSDNTPRANVIIDSIYYDGGDDTNNALEDGELKLDEGFGEANIRFKLADGYNNPYYLLESARDGIIYGENGAGPQASAARQNDGTVARDTQNNVIPFISDGTNPYMKYDENEEPRPVDKDGHDLYYKDDNGTLRQFTDWSLLRVRLETGENGGERFLAPDLFLESGEPLGVDDVIAPKDAFTFQDPEDRAKPLKSQYIYSGGNGWHYIRLTGQGSYKMALLTIVAFPSRYVIRYKPSDVPAIDDEDDPVPAHPAGNMPKIPHSDKCPTFLQGRPADDRSQEQFDDNAGSFYDIEIHPNVAISLAKPVDIYGKFEFTGWTLVDQDDKPVQRHLLDENGNWLKDENGSYITEKVVFVSGSFNVADYTQFAILNGDLGTTENDIYVLRLLPTWERIENPFHYKVALNWVDAVGVLHEENFSEFWQDILTDYKPDGSGSFGPTVKVLTTAVPFQNWIAQNPSYTFWDNINNAINGGSYDPAAQGHDDPEKFIAEHPPEEWSAEEIIISELISYFGEEPADKTSAEWQSWNDKYQKARGAMLKRSGQNLTRTGGPDFDRLGSYTYTVLQDEGTIVLWMYEDKGGLAFHKDVDAEPFIYGDEFYFTVSRAVLGTEEQEQLLDGVYKAYPERVTDPLTGHERAVRDQDAWRVRFSQGKIANIVKNDGSNWPSAPVTYFTLKDGEGIRLFVPAARYTVTELGSKSGGDYMAEVRYMDDEGHILPPKDGWDLPDPDGLWLKGSSKTYYDPEGQVPAGVSQVSATVDFAAGADDMVSTIHFSGQTSTVSIEAAAIGPYQDEAFGFETALVLPSEVMPLSDSDGNYYYFNFNLYNVTYPESQEPSAQKDLPPEQPGREPPGELEHLRSGRVVVTQAGTAPDGSITWVSRSMLAPTYAPNGAVTGWCDMEPDGLSLRDGQRIYLVCTVPSKDTEINYTVEETKRQGYHVIGESFREGRVAAAELAYQLLINSKLEGLPATGGTGTRGLLISGLVFLLSGLGLIWLNRNLQKRR